MIKIRIFEIAFPGEIEYRKYGVYVYSPSVNRGGKFEATGEDVEKMR